MYGEYPMWQVGLILSLYAPTLYFLITSVPRRVPHQECQSLLCVY